MKIYEISKIIGEIAYQGYLDVCYSLFVHRQHDQLTAVMKLYNSGNLEFED
jgi:hypothetical protein